MGSPFRINCEKGGGLMGKKVKVTTKCGGEFFYNHDQEVETVEIVEEKQRGMDLVDADGIFIFAIERYGDENGYYLEKKGGHFSLFNSSGDEIGFVGRRYGDDARLKR